MDTSLLLIHSSIEGHLGSFHFLGVVDNAATNMGVQRRLYIFPRDATAAGSWTLL